MNQAMQDYLDAAAGFRARRGDRLKALGCLAVAVRDLIAAEGGAGALDVLPLHDTVGAAMKRVEEANRSLLFAASTLDDRAGEPGLPRTVRVAAVRPLAAVAGGR